MSDVFFLIFILFLLEKTKQQSIARSEDEEIWNEEEKESLLKD